jgi:HSP20 family molecular chaperone IbpA
MQRETDAMSRMFGLPSMLDLDAFFNKPPAIHLPKVQLPSMSVAVDVMEDEQAYTIKADVPGM